MRRIVKQVSEVDAHGVAVYAVDARRRLQTPSSRLIGAERAAFEAAADAQTRVARPLAVVVAVYDGGVVSRVIANGVVDFLDAVAAMAEETRKDAAETIERIAADKRREEEESLRREKFLADMDAFFASDR